MEMLTEEGAGELRIAVKDARWALGIMTYIALVHMAGIRKKKIWNPYSCLFARLLNSTHE